MLTGYIRGQELRISTPEIAADSIKYLEAEFHFAGRDWDGYVKTAYFINGASKFALVLADDRITADMGLNLTAGEWEVKLSGVKDSSRITTTTEHIYVREFGSTEGTPPDVTPTQAEQLLAKIGDMSALETEAKTSLVAAINEAAKSGGGGGGSGEDGTGIESITYKGEDESGGNMYTVLLTDGTSYDITAPKGAKGDKGDAGEAGAPGKAATIQVGEVTTGAAGTPASVSNVGTDEAAIFDFTIPRGDKGADGAAGADGVTPHIGDNGNWYIGLTDTGKPSRGAAGANGKDGAPGKDGAAGSPGITPNIGANGNWYLGTTDTGKPSRGENGLQGPVGPVGPQGPQGEKGEDATADLTLGLTGATVGQIAKITAVDASGVPTAWSPVDMPSGGGEREWIKIGEVTTTEDTTETTSIKFTKDVNGNSLSLKGVLVIGRALINDANKHHCILICNDDPNWNANYFLYEQFLRNAQTFMIYSEFLRVDGVNSVVFTAFNSGNVKQNGGSMSTINTWAPNHVDFLQFPMRGVKLMIPDLGLLAGSKFEFWGVKA